jgi:predicted SAM-dependent methyltransferase
MLARLFHTFFARDRGAGVRGAPHIAAGGAIDAYIASHALRKLHLGAGSAGAADWLTTDADPRSEGVVYLDASAPFPIPEATFDYVYSEHMIEHLSWEAGLGVLRECLRVMKPGAAIRIATPDLAVLLGLYRERDAAAERYVRWITDRALPGIGKYHGAFVINNAFRAWGHQFLYDGELLEIALRETGFVDIRRCAYGESADPNLRGIERHGRNIGDEAVAIFETMVYEAQRPAAGARTGHAPGAE